MGKNYSFQRKRNSQEFIPLDKLHKTAYFFARSDGKEGFVFFFIDKEGENDDVIGELKEEYWNREVQFESETVGMRKTSEAITH